MAPQRPDKPGKDNDKSKPTTGQKPTGVTKRSGPRSTGRGARDTSIKPPAVKGAEGVVLDNGRYQCRLLTDQGNICGGTMKCAKHDISSHMSTKHRANSAYKKNLEKTERWPCPYKACRGRDLSSWSSLRGHVSTAHGYKGKTHTLRTESVYFRENGYDEGLAWDIQPDVSHQERGEGMGVRKQDPIEEEEEVEEQEQEGSNESDEDSEPFDPPDRPSRDHGFDRRDPPGGGAGVAVS
ncbi:hypothetical protein M426DRAFT_18027 [Hypoxylon sp. CI-4A]|nr:hypothetical protein M426DRAFT_18027 [Hypoxylon sp. CI-4A]